MAVMLIITFAAAAFAVLLHRLALKFAQRLASRTDSRIDDVLLAEHRGWRVQATPRGGHYQASQLASKEDG
jgi:hypothetical protein